MDRAACLVPNKLWFGAAPYDQAGLQQLLDNGIDTFIDLTVEGEIYPDQRPVFNYSSLVVRYCRFPIDDKRVPTDMAVFHRLIGLISSIYNTRGTKIYIHCRGGHGRSALVAACFLVYQTSINSAEALTRVNSAHHNRETMKPKYRKIGAPQVRIQKDFVHQYHQLLDNLSRQYIQ